MIKVFTSWSWGNVNAYVDEKSQILSENQCNWLMWRISVSYLTVLSFLFGNVWEMFLKSFDDNRIKQKQIFTYWGKSAAGPDWRLRGVTVHVLFWCLTKESYQHYILTINSADHASVQVTPSVSPCRYILKITSLSFHNTVPRSSWVHLAYLVSPKHTGDKNNHPVFPHKPGTTYIHCWVLLPATFRNYCGYASVTHHMYQLKQHMTV